MVSLEATHAIYVRLNAVPWFSQCGRTLPATLPFKCVPVRGWSEATALCGGHSWDCVTNEARNMLSLYLHCFYRDEFQRWNEIAYDAKEILEAGPWARVEEHNLEGFVAGRVRWDTLNAVMEAAYQHCDPPVFFLKLSKCTRPVTFRAAGKGNFPAARC